MIDTSKIRNFSIIAHIDHGKSTLADRLIEQCNAVDKRNMKAQILDSMDIERERGITVKSQTVRLLYEYNGETYHLNLMDTPGHVDFAYEVSRSLAACEGSILIIDSSQGVEAQTLANAFKAVDADHVVIPVLNKIDLPASDPDRVKEQIEDMIGIDTKNTFCISAKSGEGVKELLDGIVKLLPSPESNLCDKFSALLVDSWYDTYLGVMILIRIKSGSLTKGDTIKMLSSNNKFQIDTIGIFTPQRENVTTLNTGEIGFITGGIKQVSDCRIGDTIVEGSDNETKAFPGFKSSQQVVFCGLFPTDTSDFDHLRESLHKLSLNDASFTFEMEVSGALGHGFRCGFLVYYI